MTDPVSERPSALKRRARRPLHEAARSAYASTLGDAQREEKKRLRRADVARRARAEAEGLGQGCLAATSGAQPGFPQGGGTKGEGTGNKGGQEGQGRGALAHAGASTPSSRVARWLLTASSRVATCQ